MAKRKKPEETPSLVDQLKEAIENSGRSLYQLAKDTGVASPQLYRFMHGQRSLSLPAVEKICRALDLRLIQGEPGQAAKPARRKRSADEAE